MLHRINLTQRDLRRLPDDLPPTVEVLDLGGNPALELDERLLHLPHLRALFLSGNPLGRLPRVIGQHPTLELVGARGCHLEELPGDALPPQLRWLILTDNHLRQLPPALGQRPRLEKLALAGNALTSLPDVSACHQLALVRLGANPLNDLPNHLATLPAMAWLGFGGTPLTASREATPPALPFIPWHDLHLHDLLGQGASGIIHRATLPDGRQVAVKQFKGDITADGWPRSEVAAWATAGHHPHRVSLLGRIGDHPDGVDGVVMPLLAGSYRRLGDVPSLTSCSRDTFPPQVQFSAARVARITASMAAALADLHARTILHGDAYSHNLLEDGHGQAILGDFGAATLVPDRRWLAHESRALGCLMDDLLARTAEDPRCRALLGQLQQLRHALMDPIVAQRPSLATAAELLRALADAATPRAAECPPLPPHTARQDGR